MNLTSSVDQLIGSLEAFKAAMPRNLTADAGNSFELAFQAASEEITTLTNQTAESGFAKTTFAEFQTQNLLVDTENEALGGKPNIRQFMEATGSDFNDANELLYGVIGSNADLRDWTKIMASDNPIDAVRAATGQLFNSDKEYALVNHTNYSTPKFAETLGKVPSVVKMLWVR